MIEDRKKEFLEMDCPVTIAQNIIGGKWKLILIWRLKEGPKRFSELMRLLPAIKQSTLTQQLRELERDEIITREIFKQIPPKVEYTLTENGEELLKIIYALGTWGAGYKKTL